MVRAQHLYAADAHWWHYHIHDINCGFTGKRWSCDHAQPSNWCAHDPEEWGIEILQCNQEKGLAREPGAVNSGANSGYQAINLAYHLGATRIILLGYDMTGTSHFFGNHPAGFVGGKADRFIAAFRTIKPQQYGLEILNCSRQTALDAFPRHNLEDVFSA